MQVSFPKITSYTNPLLFGCNGKACNNPAHSKKSATTDKAKVDPKNGFTTSNKDTAKAAETSFSQKVLSLPKNIFHWGKELTRILVSDICLLFGIEFKKKNPLTDPTYEKSLGREIIEFLVDVLDEVVV